MCGMVGGRYLYLSDDHVCNLDDWILVWFREDSLPSGTLDVEAEDSERSHVGPIILGRVRDEVLPRNVHLDLKTEDHFSFSSVRTQSSCTVEAREE